MRQLKDRLSAWRRHDEPKDVALFCNDDECTNVTDITEDIVVENVEGYRDQRTIQSVETTYQSGRSPGASVTAAGLFAGGCHRKSVSSCGT